MATTFSTISKRYVRNTKKYESKLEELESQKRWIELELSALIRPYWLPEIIGEIAQWIMVKLDFDDYNVLGPFGLGATTAVYFHKGKKQYTLTFRPGNLEEGRVNIVDYSKKSNKYPQGSIGEVNGFNYEEIEVPSNAGIEWFERYIVPSKRK